MTTIEACFQERAAILVRHKGEPGEKPRRAVVLRVETDRLEICYGQGKPSPDGRHIEVQVGSADARRFQLDKTTYFRASNVCMVPRKDVIKRLGTCSSDMFLKCQRFARERHLAEAPVAPGPAVEPERIQAPVHQQPQLQQAQGKSTGNKP